MAGLVPFNHRRGSLLNTGFENFHNMLDDFFSDNWMQSRNLLRDTFKIDIKEKDDQYIVEAELPGVKKNDIYLNIDHEDLCISINHDEESTEETKNYIHKERRTSSMSRRVRLVNSDLDNIKAKLDDGVLTITVPKKENTDNTRRVEIE